MTVNKAFSEGVRFVVVGVCSNGALYLIYLFLTTEGLGPKLAMTLVYTFGIVITFVINRNWSFGHDGPVRNALFRYIGCYGIGYVVNLVGLITLVDWAGLRHQIAQAIMIVVVALMIFALQKLWVFKGADSERDAGMTKVVG